MIPVDLKYWQIIENGGNQFRVEPQKPHGANSLIDITECGMYYLFAVDNFALKNSAH